MKEFNSYKKIIEDNLVLHIPEIDEKASKLNEAMAYSLSAGGKRIRPVLLLAACDFAGGNIEEAIPAACAIEFIHTYSLIHDDLPAMDNDDLRRGKPTNHKMFGEDIAILAGDGLLNSAFEILIKNAMSFDDSAKIKNHITAAFDIAKNAGVNGMIAGQVADVENQFSNSSDEMISFINECKTAKLLQAPILAGLHIAGANEEMIADFTEYGYQLGTSFQIVDDILDITSTTEELGKTVGKDARDDKYNYVVAHGIDAARRHLSEATKNGINAIDKYGENARFFMDLLVNLETRTK